MKVIIESLDGKIVSDYCFKGWAGAINDGNDVELMSLSGISLQQKRFLRECPMPIGSVGFMEYFFHLYDIEKPLPLHCTSSIYKYEEFEYEVVENRDDLTYPVFVKPLEQVKAFTGFVVPSKKAWDYFPELNDFNGKYFTTPPFEHKIEAEWRCFIFKEQIINISSYNSEKCYVFPDVSILKNKIIPYYENAPIAYTVDLAVLSDGSTKLIELNDMWAVGHYGINEDDYFKLLKFRWVEIIKNYTMNMNTLDIIKKSYVLENKNT